jgi:hypothetical protein
MNNDGVGDYVYTPRLEASSSRIAIVRADTPFKRAVKDANRALEAESGWSIEVERGGIHPFAIPLVLTHVPVGEQAEPDPLDVLEQLTHVESLLDPLLVGTVAYKPGALTRGDFGRIPVSIAFEPPRRGSANGRRRVVAILDTAVAQHPWWRDDPPGDRFLIDARELGWRPGPRLTKPRRMPVEKGTRRELGAQEGHGTFTAGLVRQIAPEAQVLAVHTIRDDGAVQGDHVLNALEWVRGHLSKNDVVCLPFGFLPMLPADRAYLNLLAIVLGRLANDDIHVVAAAGNDGAEEPIYPAAFAESLSDLPFRIRSVGAVNVDGDTVSRAYYSNGGSWVHHHEVGTSVVSSFPTINAAAAPEFRLTGGGRPRLSADPDDFSGGFARWSGTSFSAAIHAAKIAAGTA